MSSVNVTDIKVLNNPGAFTDSFRFEVTFECVKELSADLEWRLTYVGSPDSEDCDQELESVLVGPVPLGVNRFELVTPPPDHNKIPRDDLLGVTVCLLACLYKDKEFIRVGYYVNNEYDDPDAEKLKPSEDQLGMAIEDSDNEEDDDDDEDEEEDEEDDEEDDEEVEDGEDEDADDDDDEGAADGNDPETGKKKKQKQQQKKKAKKKQQRKKADTDEQEEHDEEVDEADTKDAGESAAAAAESESASALKDEAATNDGEEIQASTANGDNLAGPASSRNRVHAPEEAPPTKRAKHEDEGEDGAEADNDAEAVATTKPESMQLPAKFSVDKIRRHILDDKPRITRIMIDWE